ncbi:MAG TPA: zf-HC2 domain-containing protein [Gaiellales bacterium]|nr:zf-HC2 domain-containing protein [Gaiellales bacterium]
MSRVDLTPLPCQELVELVTDYLEGTLPPVDRERFDRHIAGCDGCTTYLEQMRTTIRLTGRLRPEDISPDAHAALLRSFRGWSVSE